MKKLFIVLAIGLGMSFASFGQCKSDSMKCKKDSVQKTELAVTNVTVINDDVYTPFYGGNAWFRQPMHRSHRPSFVINHYQGGEFKGNDNRPKRTSNVTDGRRSAPPAMYNRPAQRGQMHTKGNPQMNRPQSRPVQSTPPVQNRKHGPSVDEYDMSMADFILYQTSN